MTNSELGIVIQARDAATKVLQQARVHLQQIGPAAKQAAGHVQHMGLNMNNAARHASTMNHEMAGMKALMAGMSMTMLGMPLLGVAVGTMKVAGEFEQLANVTQVVAGATDQQREALERLALKLGEDTVFSAKQAMEGMKELAKAGLDVKQVTAAMPGVLDMAAAGEISIAQAAETAANTLNAFGLDARETTHVANLLAAAANASSVEINDLRLALQMSSAVAAKAGMTVDELTAAIAIMGNAGVKSSDAGTSLKQMILALQAPSKEATAIMKLLGISIYDADGKMRNIRDIIGQFTDAMGKLTDQSRDQALATIFGSDAVRASNILLTGGVQKYDEMMKSVQKSGAAAEVANARMKGLAGAIEYFKGSVESFMIGQGKPFTEGLGNMIRGAADALKVFAALPEPVQRTAFQIVALAGAFLMVGGAIFATIASLQMVGAPILLLSAAIVGLAAAWINNWGNIQGRTQDAVNGITSVLTGMWELIDNLASGKLDFGSVLASGLESLKEWAGSVPDKLGDLGGAIEQWLSGIDLGSIGASIGNALARVKIPPFRLDLGFIQIDQGGIESVINQIGAGIAVLSKSLPTAGQAFRQFGLSIQQGLAAMLSFVQEQWGRLQPIISSVLGTVSKVVGTFASFVVGEFGKLLAGVKGWWDKLAPTIMPAITNVVTFVVAMVGGLVAAVSGFIGILVQFWQRHWDQIAHILQSVWGIIAGIIQTALGIVGGVIRIIMAVLAGDWQAAWEAIKDTVGDAWNGIQSIVKNAAALVGGILSLAWSAVSDITGAAWAGILSIIRSGVNKSIDELNNLIGALNQIKFTIPDWVPELGGKTWGVNLEQIKRLSGAMEEIPDLGKMWKSAHDEIESVMQSTTQLGAGQKDAISAVKTATDAYLESVQSGNTEVNKGIGLWDQLKKTIQGTITGLSGRLNPVAPDQSGSAYAGLEDFEKRLRKSMSVASQSAKPPDLPKISYDFDEMAKSAKGATEAAKEAGISVGDLKQALVSLHPATLAAASAVAYWNAEIENVNLAISANRDQLKAAEAEYQAMQDRLAGLNQQLSEAKQRLAELASPRLTGMTEFNDKIAAVERQLKRLQLAEAGVPSVDDILKQFAGQTRIVNIGGLRTTVTGISKEEAEAKRNELLAKAIEQVKKQFPEMTAEMEAYLKTLPVTREGLEKILETLRLTKDLKYEEALKKIREAAEGVPQEMTFEEVMRQISETKARIGDLTGQISAQEAAMRAQKAVIDALNVASATLNATLAEYQKQLKDSEDKQKLVNDALELAYGWFTDDRQKIIDMGGAAAEQVPIIDEKTRALIDAVTTAATSSSTTATQTLQGMVTAYKTDMAIAVSKVAELSNEIKGIPTSWTTIHTTVHRDVYENGTVSGQGGAGAMSARSVTSPGIDYERLGRALATALTEQGIGKQYSLTIQTNAPQENLVTDFKMLEALAGA